jgi:4'-phosphopantetheinyl transferase
MPCLINDSLEDSASPIPVDMDDLPAAPLTLSADDVHVWQARLDDHDAGGLRLLLSADEISRADRFHFPKDRDHYTVARGLLRKLLAAYLRLGPAELQFTYAEKGKPSLVESQRSLINFNLAHSHGVVLYAFSTGREIGVDVEFLREDFAGDQIAERFFSPGEIDTLRSVPASLRKEAFFNCWTRKEAYIKARGEGLSLPLDEFDVSLLPGEDAALLRNHKEPAEVGRWTMRSIPVPTGYAAALVVEGNDWRLKSFSLDRK